MLDLKNKNTEKNLKYASTSIRTKMIVLEPIKYMNQSKTNGHLTNKSMFSIKKVVWGGAAL